MFDFENRFLTASDSVEDKEPFELVIDKNLRSRAKRIQDDTREELTRVLERVENTLVEYEKNIQQPIDQKFTSSNIEYLVDISELEEILNDKVAKFKYKQQITVFIVGQSEAIKKKNLLLEQLNEFFNEQTENFAPNKLELTEFDFDLENVKEEVEDSLETAKIMGTRLEEINESIIQYLIQSTSSKQAKALIERSRKKLEKSLKDAREELSSLTDRLKIGQSELNMRDDKIKSLMRQIELKNAEITNLPKRLARNEDFLQKEKEIEELKKSIKSMETEIKVFKLKLNKSGIDITDLNEEIKEIVEEEKKIEAAKIAQQNQDQEINKPQTEQTTVVDNDYEIKQYELSDIEIKEIEVLRYKNEQEMNALRREYEIQLETINNKLKDTEAELEKYKKKREKNDYSPENLDVNRRGKNQLKLKNQKNKKKEKSLELDINEETENLAQIEADAENEKQLRLIDELENGGDVEDIDLTTDDWVNVNPNEITKRYDMLRRYATVKINNLKRDYQNLESSDKEKIYKLKKQYFDHKKLWETERQVLLNVKDMELNWDQERSDFLDQAELAYKLQIEAQDAAEKAIKQLENFITEDAKLDRESAENTIQILRERSRTITSLSIGNKEDLNNIIDNSDQEEKAKKLSTEKSEKIQVSIENNSIKFPNKLFMDKIIEYINFESSNKYCLILNHVNSNTSNNSRPSTREKSNSKAQSPSNRNRKQSLKRETSNLNSKQSERKNSKQQVQSYQPSQPIQAPPQTPSKPEPSFDNSIQELNKSIPINDNLDSNPENIEQVLNKVLNDDEAVIIELRNSVRSRNSLRSKHLAQLEESKEKLNEIKQIAAKKLVNNGIEQDISMNEDDLNKSHGPKRDISSARVRAQTEAILNRVSSSKTRKSSINSGGILSHPIVLEYVKTYDIIVNFKNLISKNLPTSTDTRNGFLTKHSERLEQIKMIEFDPDVTITPQIINMTTNVDYILNEIQIVFSNIVDELVVSKYELIEKDQQLIQLNSMNIKVSRPNTSMNLNQFKSESEFIDLEKSLKQKEILLSEKENEVENLKSKLEIEKQQYLKYQSENSNQIEILKKDYETNENNLKTQIEVLKTEIEEMSKLINKTTTTTSIFPSISQKQRELYIEKKEPSIMFTRLDLIQNQKRLKGALAKGNLTEQAFQNASKLMEDLMSIQSTRFIELVKKYVNHKQLNFIKENLINKNDEDNNSLIEKMQKIQEKKINRYMETIRKLREKRLNLAYNLNETLNDIEQQSGIFLVKPFYSYQSLDPNLQYVRLNKLKRTPSGKRVLNNNTMTNNTPRNATEPCISMPKIGQNWNIQDSYVSKTNLLDSKKITKSASDFSLLLTTPRLLEMDINRVMISQNQISATINPNDRYSANIRSYIAINRPTGFVKKNSDPETVRASLKNISSTLLPPLVDSTNDKSKAIIDLNEIKENRRSSEIFKDAEQVQKISLSKTNIDSDRKE